MEYQGITGTADNQADFYNYHAEEMIDNTYNRFIDEECRWEEEEYC